MLIGQLPAPVGMLVGLGGVDVRVRLAAHGVVDRKGGELVEPGVQGGGVNRVVGRNAGDLRIRVARPAHQLGTSLAYGGDEVRAPVAQGRRQLFRFQGLGRPHRARGDLRWRRVAKGARALSMSLRAASRRSA